MTVYSTLEKDIIEYNIQYREGTPTISDQEYDYLIERLVKEQPNSELLNMAVIEEPKENRKCALPIPMYSLEKDKSVEEFQKHLSSNGLPKDTACVISPKLDGISLVVDESPPKKAWTRGDGEVGQESTVHFDNMARNDRNDFRYVHSYGEAIISKENWVKCFLGKISPYNGKPYKSARNTVGGLLNTDDPREELKYVDYIRYGTSVDGSVDKLAYNRDKVEMLGICNSLNAVEFKYRVCKANEITEDLLDNLYQDWSKDYQIDGLVIDINDKNIRNNIGRERNNNPKYARAIKLPKWGENAIVKVLNITWQVSKQGNLKPVINIEPTDIGGATISNVTAYNAKYLFDNHIAVGSIIEITRSGDVIPKHLKTISWDEFEFDNMMEEIACPSCGDDVFWDDTDTELFCVNPDCDEMRIGKLVHFFKTLEVEEFGEPTIIKFYKAGYQKPLDVLKMSITDILSIEGFANKSTNNLLKEFQKLKDNGTTLAKLIHACDSMEGRLGSKMIQLIFDEISGDDPYDQKVERLIQINGIAEKSAVLFNSGMQKFLKPEFQELFNYITILNENVMEITGNKFKGFRMCFTGVRPSKEQEKYLIENGAEVVSGISSKTTHLVVKDLSDKTLRSEKSTKAMSLGVEIITMEDLFK